MDTKSLRRLTDRAIELLQSDVEPRVKEMPLDEILQSLQIHQAELQAQYEQLEDAQQQNRMLAERFSQLFQAAPDGLVLVDGEGYIREANQRALEYLKLKIQHVDRLRLATLIRPPANAIAFSKWRNSGVDTPLTLCTDQEAGNWLQFRQIRFEANTTLISISDVSALQQNAAELAAARADAEAAARAKSLFLATMSHEIRTPIHVVLGHLQLLERADIDNELREHVVNATRASKLLHELIGDVLDFSKIDAGRIELEEEPFDLRDVLKHVESVMRTLTDDKPVRVVAQIDERIPPLLIGDSTRIKQVLLNLASNAAKFTRQGQLTLNAQVDAADDASCLMHFTVSDTGVGIARDKLKAVFESFSQEDVSTTRQFGGTGLGLTIADAIVRLMGGQIEVESQRDEGSTFRFAIRFPIPGERRTQIHADQRAQIDALTGSDKALAGTQVLVVEDNALVQTTTRRMLEAQGATVKVVDGGHAAVDAARDNRYDAVLMDIHMPGLDGYETTGMLRELPNCRDVPIIGLSGNATTEDRDQALNSGMNDYLTKPVSIELLVSAILSALEGLRDQPAADDTLSPTEG